MYSKKNIFISLAAVTISVVLFARVFSASAVSTMTSLGDDIDIVGKLTTGGSVGIGTTTPSTKLDVVGGNVRFRNTQNANAYVETYSIHADGRMGFRTNGGLPIFRWAGGNAISFGPGSQFTGFGLGGSIGFRDGVTVIGGTVIGPDGFSAGTHKSLGIGTPNIQPRAGFGAPGIVDLATFSITGNAFSGQRPSIRLTGDALIFRTDTGTGTVNAGTEVMRVTGGNVGIGTTNPTSKLDINADSIRLQNSKTPASATAPCSKGEISWDANAVYVCVATNTWKKAALTGF